MVEASEERTCPHAHGAYRQGHVFPYSHIHYASAQARVITVREAARLQSFPDGFVFSGTMNPAFHQIGNAVPPLMARALGESMLASLGDAIARRSSMVAAE